MGDSCVDILNEDDFVVFHKLSQNSVVEIVWMKEIGDVVFIVEDMNNVPGLAKAIEVSYK